MKNDNFNKTEDVFFVGKTRMNFLQSHVIDDIEQVHEARVICGILHYNSH
jgi:hypothetical protein